MSNTATEKVKLIGSTTSPFVRRIRLFFQDYDFDFVSLDIFAPEDREVLTKNNPALKVPAIIDGELCVYDSRVIYRYLTEKFQLTALTWQQENLLTLIDAANDSLVTLLLSSRSKIDVNEDKLFFNLQHERIAKILSVLDSEVENGQFDSWHYPTVCLLCLLDWAKFRDLCELSSYQHLEAFYQQFISHKGVAETDPR